MSPSPQPGLGLTFKALADPTRRAILARLVQGRARVTDLARPFGCSLNAVSKHLKLLERAGLIRRRIQGRTHWLSFSGEPLAEAEEWIREISGFWEERLDALESLLKERQKERTEMTEKPIVRITRLLPAGPEEVYKAWTDPESLKKWMCPGEARLTTAEVEPRKGGRFKLIMEDGEGVYEHTGEYLDWSSFPASGWFSPGSPRPPWAKRPRSRWSSPPRETRPS